MIENPSNRKTSNTQNAPQAKANPSNLSRSAKSTATAQSEITHIDGSSTSEEKKEPLQDTLNNLLDEENQEGEKLLLPRDSFDRKLENIRTIRIDKDFRSSFSDAMSLWERGKKSIAITRFKGLLKQNSSFIKAHKHMFTDCAIQLRKIHQNDLALTFAIRCTDLSPDDSHTFFNVGRLYYELREYKSAASYLEKALELEPDLSPALRLQIVIANTLTRAAKAL